MDQLRGFQHARNDKLHALRANGLRERVPGRLGLQQRQIPSRRLGVF